MAGFMIKLPSTAGTKEAMNFKGAFPIIILPHGDLLQFSHDLFNGFVRISLFHLPAMMDMEGLLSHGHPCSGEASPSGGNKNLISKTIREGSGKGLGGILIRKLDHQFPLITDDQSSMQLYYLSNLGGLHSPPAPRTQKELFSLERLGRDQVNSAKPGLPTDLGWSA